MGKEGVVGLSDLTSVTVKEKEVAGSQDDQEFIGPTITIQIRCWRLSGQMIMKGLRDNGPGALSKEIVFAVDMDHAIFENTFPLVLHASDLKIKSVR